MNTSNKLKKGLTCFEGSEHTDGVNRVKGVGIKRLSGKRKCVRVQLIMENAANKSQIGLKGF